MKRRERAQRKREFRARVFRRDEYICHICGDPTNRLAVVPELDAPVVDHVIPLAAGGADDETNMKCAHFWCNSVKGDKPLDQVA